MTRAEATRMRRLELENAELRSVKHLSNAQAALTQQEAAPAAPASLDSVEPNP